MVECCIECDGIGKTYQDNGLGGAMGVCPKCGGKGSLSVLPSGVSGEVSPPPLGVSLLLVRSLRLLDAPGPGPTAEDHERQRQKDVEALVKILEGRGVPRRLLHRCRARTAEGVCDAYRVSGESCVLCGDGLPPRVA